MSIAKIKINTNQKHKISPYLFMQFMEPLGTADASVDAAWDYVNEKWFDKAIDATRLLAPTMIRFGGCFASQYRWREGVGPYEKRIPAVNYAWDGFYSNHVGTHEFLDFCRQVNAEPLINVNMESDGRMYWAYPKEGVDRFGTAKEAAEWVDYCNNPDNKERHKNGEKNPFGVKYWQIGNETSYEFRGYDSDTTKNVTEKFAKEMKKADPSIKILGWGDYKNLESDMSWCGKMASLEDVDIIAFHHHYGWCNEGITFDENYHKDYGKAYENMLETYKTVDEHIDILKKDANGKRLAMTEGHYTFVSRYRNTLLSSWGAGIAYARIMLAILKNSDVLDIATMADFMGNVWQVNAIMLHTPMSFQKSLAYLQPVGYVMSLFGKHIGENYLDVEKCHGIDVIGSRTGNKIYLHMVNTSITDKVELDLDLGGEQIKSMKMYYVSEDPQLEITYANPNAFSFKEKEFTTKAVLEPCSASVLEITI